MRDLVHHAGVRALLAVEVALLAVMEVDELARFAAGARDDSTIAALSAAATFAAIGALVVLRWPVVVVTSPSSADPHAAARALASARHRVDGLLDNGDVTIALQPVIDLSTGRLSGVEALARFPDGRGVDEWFDDAHEAGRTLALDRLAFTSALRLMRMLPKTCHLSINAGPQLLTEGSLLREITEGELEHERLVVEVTEHVKIHNYRDLHALLTPARERGVRLAVDDTGAGYASLNHVLQLRPDIIKLDRSLITGLSVDPARRSLVTALVLLALDLGASVTAEGVETPQELETLASLGVDYAQGYLLARPTTNSLRWRRWHDRNWLYPEASGQIRAREPATAES